MDFGSAIKSGFKNTFKYQGRASRSEFWWFYLFNILSFAGFMIIDTILAAIFPHSGDQNNVNIAQLIIYGLLALVGLVYFVASCLASLSLTIRRLHDSDKSGWFLLLGLVPFGGIVLLVFYCLDGTRGPNQFGDDPLRPAASAASVF